MRIRKLRVLLIGVFGIVCFGLGVCLTYIIIDDPISVGTRSLRAKSDGPTYELVILILSALDNKEQRNAIRNTWLSKKPTSVRAYFVLGTKNIQRRQQYVLLQKENGQYNDLMLLSDVVDTYDQLTYKVLRAFIWTNQNVRFNYLLKCDDDTFVRLKPILEELKNSSPPSKYYWGFFNGASKPIKRGPWEEKQWFLCDRYLPYALGGGYILSYDLIEYISNNWPLLQLYNSEDVTVGTWLAPLRLVRKHDVRFDTEYKSRGCVDDYLITHKQSVDDMKSKHEQLIASNGRRMCEKQIRKRKSFEYNWDVPPSRCCIRNDTSIV